MQNEYTNGLLKKIGKLIAERAAMNKTLRKKQEEINYLLACQNRDRSIIASLRMQIADMQAVA